MISPPQHRMAKRVSGWSIGGLYSLDFYAARKKVPTDMSKYQIQVLNLESRGSGRYQILRGLGSGVKGRGCQGSRVQTPSHRHAVTFCGTMVITMTFTTRV
eukprot:838874-Rhodomonas_salina.3